MVGGSVEQWQCMEKIHFVPFFAGTPWYGDAWRFYTNNLYGLGTLWHVAELCWSCAQKSAHHQTIGRGLIILVYEEINKSSTDTL